MIAETVSDSFTDFQNSRRYTSCAGSRATPSGVKPCGPGFSE